MNVTRAKHQGSLSRLPPSEEGAPVQAKSELSSYPALIQTCLHQGAWTLADDELDYIIKGEILPLDISSPCWRERKPETLSEDDTLTATELKAISRCLK